MSYQFDQEKSSVNFWKLTTGMVRDEADTLDLRYGVYAAQPIETLTNFIVFLNGRTEWIEKYQNLPDALKLPKSTGFLTWDHRGQGASGGARAYVDSYDSYANDANCIVSEVVKDKPYVLLGHSMGCLIGLYGVLKGYLTPQKMVLCSPLLGLPEKPVPSVIARPAARLLNLLGLSYLNTGVGSFQNAEFAGNALTHHYDNYQAIKQAPYPVPAASIGWVAQTFQALSLVFSEEALADLDIPTLIIGGSDERVVDFNAFRKWVDLASSFAKSNVELKIISGGRHELLYETDEYFLPTLQEIALWFDL